ncbi:MAG TPA: rhodanese-like domain-containing protein [Candidatus Elarobacter sp.]|nr:rhodanese-like domain-containing protein [Dongiaceae bacterium]HZW52824.1 rhodanese-like domain-containing protein [Candidatus Elarobacter sp.]
MTGEISVEELKRRHDAGERLVLLDVREPDEVATASIPWATAIPMMQIPARIGEIPRDVPVVVMCHHGGRSERVAQYLAAQGYAGAVNLNGGIDAWSASVDPSVPRY